MPIKIETTRLARILMALAVDGPIGAVVVKITEALPDWALIRSVTVTPKAVPCGGCGETDPDSRCIGCFHDFHPVEGA